MPRSRPSESPPTAATDPINLPPQDLDAERSVLGSILLDNDRLDDVADILHPDSFYLDANRVIYACILRLREKSGHRAFDPVIVAAALRDQGKLHEIGDEKYLLEVLASVPYSAHARHYAGIVAEKAMRRAVISAANQAMRDSYGHVDIDDLLHDTEAAMQRVLEQRAGSQSTTASLADALIDLQDHLTSERPRGISTGFTGLDRIIQLRPANLLILAARPGMGKTALVGNMAMRIAQHSPVAFFSLEQSKLELTERILSGETGIALPALRDCRLSELDRDKILDASGRLADLGLYIDDSPKSLSQLTASARLLKRKHGIGLLVVDYLQLVDPDEADRRAPRETQVATISRGLKRLAKSLAIPVIVLAQLNREVEKRDDKRPRLSDLRESGSIEQDADIVMFLHRPDVYDPEDRPNEAEAIIAKHRSGPKGTAVLVWHGPTTSFDDAQYGPQNETDDGVWYQP